MGSPSGTWCWTAVRGMYSVQPLQLGLEENELGYSTVCACGCITVLGCVAMTIISLYLLCCSLVQSLVLFLRRALLSTTVIPICASICQFSSHSLEICMRMWNVILCDTMLVFQWVFSLLCDIWFGFQGHEKTPVWFLCEWLVQFSRSSTTVSSWLESKIKQK